MWEWFLSSFSDDPAGWIALILTGATAALSAVFWRKTWAVLKWVGRGAQAIVRGISSIRVTTEKNLKPKKNAFLVPPRWDITQLKGERDRTKWVLANWSKGSVARNVQLDVGRGAHLRSAAAWERIDGDAYGPFVMVLDDIAEVLGVEAFVSWDDARGTRCFDRISLGG